jgi:hypothetical protein
MDRDRGRHIRGIDGYAEPLRERFATVRTEPMPGSYRFPYTMVVLEARP